ncbi:unnamed protein product [Leptidea sinapis]|uniref:Major facilitator superfamily (MFS) profile domain-containing protein n=1 Tax=Leptidea sinapis TaxID=189913 RepID=A0A5E4R4X3_9NEOP|nr:unnamed protein product [Leptidea sinapis]
MYYRVPSIVNLVLEELRNSELFADQGKQRTEKALSADNAGSWCCEELPQIIHDAFPCSPPLLPVLGNILSVWFSLKQLKFHHRVWQRWSQKYGNLLGLRLGFVNILVVSGNKNVKEVLSREVFDGRPSGFFYMMRSFGKKLGIVFSDGATWTKTRRAVIKALKNFSHGSSSMENNIGEEVSALIEVIKENAGKPIIVNDMFDVAIVNIVWKLVAGKRSETIDYHKATLDIQNPRDVIDKLLIDTLEKQSETCVETVSNTIVFMLLYLVRAPEVRTRLQDEIDRVVGTTRLPSLSDRSRMVYTEAVILETLRISSVAAVGIPHMALQDATLGEYVIPKGTFVLLAIHDLHNGCHWNNPHEFRPERFLTKEGNLIQSDWLMPFGYGKRRCIGEGLARSELFLFTTYLLQRFHLKIPEEDPLPSTEPHDGVTLSARKFRVIFQRRHSCIFIMAVDFFQQSYPNSTIMFDLSSVYIGSACVAVFINNVLIDVFTYNNRITFGIFLSLSTMIVISVCNIGWEEFPKTVAYNLNLAAIGLVAIGCTIQQSSYYGLTGCLPPRYTQAIDGQVENTNFGVLKLQSPTLPLSPDENVEFGVCYSNPVYAPNQLASSAPPAEMTGDGVKSTPDVAILAPSEDTPVLGTDTLATAPAASSPLNSHRWAVARTIYPYMVSIGLVYFTTLSLYPGIAAEVPSCRLGSWMAIILMSTFNLFDFIGKIAAAWPYEWSRSQLLMASGLRLFLVPLFLLCASPRQSPHIVGDMYPILFSVALGFTNGLFGSVPMIIAPSRVARENREIVGNLMTLSYNGGLLTGTTVSYTLNNMLGPPTASPCRFIYPTPPLPTIPPLVTTAASNITMLLSSVH